MTALKVSRLQKRGQVTIPVEIRQRLGLEEGDLVAFIETAAGVVISPQEVVPAETLAKMESYLQQTDGFFARGGRGQALDLKAVRRQFINEAAGDVQSEAADSKQ